MAQYFWIGVNENDDTGIDFNSFVDIPAHMKGMIYFSKESIRYAFNDEKRMVTGVMIAANQPIYRWSPEIGDHYVVFKPETIDLIRRKFFKNGFHNNLNVMHDPKQVQNGVTLVDSYIVSSTDPKLPNVPEALSAMNLQDGSWIASYFIENDELWNKVKEGKFGGFSVEGWFDKVKIKTNKMNKQKRSIWSMFSNETTPAAENFSQAVTADGVAVFYEGDLVEGTAVFVELDGQQIPAPEGDHELTLEDGTVKVVTLDSNGIVTAIADVTVEEPMSADDNTVSNEDQMRAEVADAMMKQTAEIHERFTAIEQKFIALEAENKVLKAEIETISKTDKFGAAPLKATSDSVSYRDLLKK